MSILIDNIGPQPAMPDTSPSGPRRYWFPAKRYGWGWGLPCTWQGWAVLGGYCVLLPFAIWLFPPHLNMPGFVASVVGLSAGLVAICWATGEPPKWRWG
jgi:hypothetical protein